MPLPLIFVYLSGQMLSFLGSLFGVYMYFISLVLNYLGLFSSLRLRLWSFFLTALTYPAVVALSRSVLIKILGARTPPKKRGCVPDNIRFLTKGTGVLDASQSAQDTYDVLEPPLNLSTLFEDHIFTAEPGYITYFLAHEPQSYEKTAITDKVMTCFGTKAFKSDSDLSKFHGSVVGPFFSKERSSDLDIFETQTNNTIQKMKISFQQGLPVDFQDLMSRFAVDTATNFILGKPVGALEASGLSFLNTNSEKPKSHQVSASDVSTAHFGGRFLGAFQRIQKVFADRLRLGKHWPIFEIWKDRTVEHVKVLDEFIQPIIEQALENKAENSIEQAGEERSLLQQLVSLTDDKDILRQQLYNVLNAACDNTAATLTFIVYMLAEHPDVLRRLREEVLNQVGHTARPTYGDIKKLKLLRAIINETLRLYTPMPGINRKVAGNRISWWESIVRGEKPYCIWSGARITFSTFMIHRRTDLWAADAASWNPDRFFVRSDDIPQFCFLPFGAGAHVCPGQQFAYNEISFFLVRLVQSFSDMGLALGARSPERLVSNWKPNPYLEGREQVRIKSNASLFIEGGLWVKMKEVAN